MGQGQEPRHHLAVVGLLFHALRVNDRAINGHAAGVFRQLGPELTPRLLSEAASKKNSPSHRLRVLAVIERVGRLSGPDDWLDLTVLMTDKNPQIRAAWCLVRHSPAPAVSGVGG